MNIWFTSDWHLGHANIIKHCGRPFKDLNEMNETIIENYNSLVKPDDVVYNLGDLFFKTSYWYCHNLLGRFNGKIRVVVGNHDKKGRLDNFVKDGLIQSVNDVLGMDIDKQYIWLSHYPHRSWNRSFHGSLHFHGHVHSRSNVCVYRNSIDVGVDAWKFKPVNFDEIVEKVKLFDNERTIW